MEGRKHVVALHERHLHKRGGEREKERPGRTAALIHRQGATERKHQKEGSFLVALNLYRDDDRDDNEDDDDDTKADPALLASRTSGHHGFFCVLKSVKEGDVSRMIRAIAHNA